MDFTPRVRQILSVLLTQQDVLPVKNLAQNLNISKRTVQRELDYISYILNKYNISLCAKTGIGIWLEGEESQKQMLLNQLETQEKKDYADKSERRKNLMLELLKDQTPKKLYYYANLFSVSESTISKDLEHVETWFARFKLEIIRKQGYGVALQGNEKNFRVAIREFIAKYMDTPSLDQLYRETDVSTTQAVGIKNIKNTYQLLNEEVLYRVKICFASIPDERIKRLTEESYVGLILHVAIAIERVLAGEFIDSNHELMEQLQQDEDYNLAVLIVISLEKEFAIEIPDIEIAFICLHIKGSKIQRTPGSTAKDHILTEPQKNINELVQGIIVAYDEQLAHVLGADEEFTTGLAAHLRPAMVRLQNHMLIENPHLKEIKESYADIFHRCVRVGKYLEAIIGCEIPETEVGFLALHFGAAIVRMESERENKRVVDIGVVCSSGIGISRLMVSRLQNFLKSRAKLTTYGKSDLSQFVLEHNDFFVSSMELGEIDSEVIQVNPLLPEADLVRIDEKVQQYEFTPKRREKNNDFEQKMEKINDLASRIKEILRNYFCLELPENVKFQQILEEAAQRITSYSEIQQRIVEEIKKREEIATQIIPELEIALLHARIKGIFQCGFYVCVPKDGARFTNAYMQAAKAVIIMLIPDDEQKHENSQLLGYLSESLINEEEFIDTIKQGDELAIREALSRLMKEYFNQYLDAV
jgi:mannitol operon transcriptional antiterminator